MQRVQIAPLLRFQHISMGSVALLRAFASLQYDLVTMGLNVRIDDAGRILIGTSLVPLMTR